MKRPDDENGPNHGAPPRAGWVADDPVPHAQQLSPEALCEDALAFFLTHPDLEALPVASQGRPFGLVTRSRLIAFACRERGRVFARVTLGAFLGECVLRQEGSPEPA